MMSARTAFMTSFLRGGVFRNYRHELILENGAENAEHVAGQSCCGRHCTLVQVEPKRHDKDSDRMRRHDREISARQRRGGCAGRHCGTRGRAPQELDTTS